MSNYESWRISYQSSEAAARSAWQEMIRLHHRVNELEAQLSAIGAGGVEPLRKSAAAPQAVPDSGLKTIGWLLDDAMNAAVKNGANSISMPDDYVELAAWLAGIPTHPAEGVPAQTDHATELAPPNSLPTFDECALRVENSNFLEKRAAGGGYGSEHDSKTATQLHRFIYEYDDADPARSSWFLHRLELLLNEVRSATQPAAQGMELANCKGGKWLTVVYHDIQPGDESRTIVEHPKVSALSWSHALHDRDAAIAAQAKRGGAAMTHHTDDQYLMDAVLNCPHSITHDAITLHFSPKQAGHNALAQLRHRLAAADAAAKAREMELLAVIEDLERLVPLINRGGAP